MIIKKAFVLTENFEFKKLDIEIKKNKIIKISDNLNSNSKSINAENCYLIPGLIDIHTHGCVGFDTCDANLNGYKKMSNFYASKGITSFLFTTMTYSEEILKNIVKKISEFIDSNEYKSYPQGIYMEGPFINPIKKGAQSEKYIINPDINMFNRLQKESNNKIKIIALAPEMKNSLDFIKQVSPNIKVSIAHTNADYNITKKAINNGASDVTHLFNAMPGFKHREPGVIGAAFDSNVYVEIICDGIHLHPSTIRSIYKIVDPNRIILISDSMQASGMPDGNYSLGGQDVILKNGKAILNDGTIAGSATNLFDCVKNNISFGIPKENAIKSATINPAKFLGIDNSTGSIKTGKLADLVLLDKKFNIKNVWIQGENIQNI